MTTNLPTTQTKQTAVGFSTAESFELMQRIAIAITSSNLVPEQYRGKENIGNAMIALNMAMRHNSDPLMVMQNIHIVHGRPSFSSQYIIAAINTSGKFTGLRFRMEGTGDSRSCVAYTTDLSTGEILEGPPVSIEMAKAEGWYSRNGSKWKTMPENMLRYRAASFFGKNYAPEILMGMQTVEEIHDIIDVTPARSETVATDLNAAIQANASKGGKRKEKKSPETVTVDASLTEENQSDFDPNADLVASKSNAEAGSASSNGVIDVNSDEGLWED